MESKLLSILFTDIVGKVDLDDSLYEIFIEKQKNIIKTTCEKHGGIFVKQIGEGMMYIFNTPSLAILSSIEIQKEIQNNNINKNYGIKIGINTGEVEYQNKYNFETNIQIVDVFGTPVNIAARIKAIAKKGDILFSEFSLSNISHNSFTYKKYGYKKLKGISKKVLVYKIDYLKENKIDYKIFENIENGTIMNTDIVGYTKKVSSQNRTELIRLLKNQKNIIEPIIINNKGKIIKTIGDAYISFFHSPTNALNAAKQIQDKISLFNSKVIDIKNAFNIRIGINSGEIYIKDGEYTGITCEIAEILEQTSKPGNIYFSENVLTNINKKNINYYYIGKRLIKGKKMKIYKIDIGEFNTTKFIKINTVKIFEYILELLTKIIILMIVISIIFLSIFLYLKNRDNNPKYIQNNINIIDKKFKILKFKYNLFMKKEFK